MEREIVSHKVNGMNEALGVTALDDPGEGGASHEYRIAGSVQDGADGVCYQFKFQKGPIAEVGVNGLSNESLLAVVEDRLRGFQSGPFACDENAFALTRIQEAMMWLHKRTRDRMLRGVEGTNQK